MHISFDLETLGTTPDSVILSIGAALFDFNDGVSDIFYVKINPDLQGPRIKSPDTLAWWAKQNEKVRNEAVSGRLSLIAGLRKLHYWIPAGAQVWGNGATFDISILENAYNYEPPWQFRKVRDMRTIVYLAQELAGFNKDIILRQGDHHSALDDAVHQAHVIAGAYKALRGYHDTNVE